MEHLQRKYAWNKIQTNLAKSMMLAGANEEAIEKLVRGYGEKTRQADLSLACPKCNSVMQVASLEDGRKARYCRNDRICLPLK